MSKHVILFDNSHITRTYKYDTLTVIPWPFWLKASSGLFVFGAWAALRRMAWVGLGVNLCVRVRAYHNLVGDARHWLPDSAQKQLVTIKGRAGGLCGSLVVTGSAPWALRLQRHRALFVVKRAQGWSRGVLLRGASQ